MADVANAILNSITVTCILCDKGHSWLEQCHWVHAVNTQVSIEALCRIVPFLY